MIDIKDNITYWKTGDGRCVPLPFLSDLHINSAIQSSLESIDKLCCKEKNALLVKRQQDLETAVAILGNEKLRRKREGIAVEEHGNPYYDVSLRLYTYPAKSHIMMLRARTKDLIMKDDFRAARKIIKVLEKLGEVPDVEYS